MMQKSIYSETDNIFSLLIDGVRNGDIFGHVIQMNRMEEHAVHSSMEAVWKMNEIMDSSEDQRFHMELRSFYKKGDKEKKIPKREDQPVPSCNTVFWEYRKGRRTTAAVRVFYRCHTSWQGEISWNGQRVYFRSVLELLHLLTEIISAMEK